MKKRYGYPGMIWRQYKIRFPHALKEMQLPEHYDYYLLSLLRDYKPATRFNVWYMDGDMVDFKGSVVASGPDGQGIVVKVKRGAKIFYSESAVRCIPLPDYVEKST